MLQKINRQFSTFNFGFLFVCLLIIGLLVYSRFVNIGWGLPFPMHPDERNMAVAIQQLECKLPKIKLNFPTSIFESWPPVTDWVKVLEPFDILNCFNPHFFAYGQLPLYLAYGVVWAVREVGGGMIGFEEATLALRTISAIASIVSSIVVIKIIKIITAKKEKFWWWILVIFSPFFIQFTHFGTTESFLMLFYTTVIYLSLLFVENRLSLLSFVINNAIIVGMALATKVSSLIFAGLPLMIIIFRKEKKFARLYSFLTKTFDVFIFILISFLVFILFSPHNFLHWQEFISSIRYESDVALGNYIVFYTRQFVKTVPIFFQITKVFPYGMGLVLGLLGGLGLLGLGWKDKKINLIRLAFFIYFLPNAFIFAKWTRFMAPVFPVLLIFGIVFLERIKVIKIIKVITVIISILPGIFYLSIYLKPDVRFQATDWINKNIPNNSYVLSETANVVDIPLENKNKLNVISFNFYDLDESRILQEDLKKHLEKADYIFVPSRRIFANHYKEKYPIVARYYQDLFDGKLGFKKVAEFSSGLDDEGAEETWTVFDHPTIRIFKKL